LCWFLLHPTTSTTTTRAPVIRAWRRFGSDDVAAAVTSVDARREGQP
jgi:hypothetical protein